MNNPAVQLVEWPDASAVKVVESPHPPYIKTYRVGVEFLSMADAQDFVAQVCEQAALSKSSGIDGDAGDWTQAGDGTDYPGKLVALPSQADADAAGQPEYRLVDTENVPSTPSEVEGHHGETNHE